MYRIVGKRLVAFDAQQLADLLTAHARVVLEVGAGDGAFLRALVAGEPTTLAIGLNASTAALERPSRLAAKLADNPLFLRAAIEAPPPELAGLADALHVYFPWGSLFGGLVVPDDLVLANVAGLMKLGGAFQFLLTYDPVRDAALALPALNAAHFDALAVAYRRNGLAINERRLATLEEIAASRSSWAKRVRSNRRREVWLLRGVRGVRM